MVFKELPFFLFDSIALGEHDLQKQFVKLTFPSFFCIPFESDCDLLTFFPQDPQDPGDRQKNRVKMPSMKPD